MRAICSKRGVRVDEKNKGEVAAIYVNTFLPDEKVTHKTGLKRACYDY